LGCFAIPTSCSNCGQTPVLTQRLQDAEAQDVLALMGGYQAGLSKEDVHLPGGEIHRQVPPTEQDQSEKPADVYAGLEIYEEYQ